MIARAADGLSFAFNGYLNATRDTVPKRAGDDSTGTDKYVQTRFDTMNCGIAINAAVRDGDVYRAIFLRFLLLNPSQRPQQHDIRNRPISRLRGEIVT